MSRQSYQIASSELIALDKSMIHETLMQPIMRILKTKGAPILGVVQLQVDPRYDCEAYFDQVRDVYNFTFWKKEKP